MIRVQRSGKPKVLSDKANNWLSALQSATSKEDQDKAEKKYRHPQIRDALNGMFAGKCAYCESDIQHVGYAHIEHYVPRRGPNGDPAKTFDWDNLLLSCSVCNGAEFKGDRFPSASDGGPLVNPVSDDPANHFDFVFDKDASLASVYGRTGRGIVTEGLLGLNRQHLRAVRSRHVRMALACAQQAARDPEAVALVEELKSASSPYLAFVQPLLDG